MTTKSFPPLKKPHMSKFQQLFPFMSFTTHSRIALPLFLSSPVPLSIISLSSPSSHNSPPAITSPHIHLPSLLRKTLTSSIRPLANPPFLSSSPHAPLSSNTQSPNPRIPYLLPNPPTSSSRTPFPPAISNNAFVPPNEQSILIVSQAMYLFLSCTSRSTL